MHLRPGALVLGWTIQVRNIHALMSRDVAMRYGRDNIGFVWVVLEPMILTVGVMIVWSAIAVGGEKDGVKVVEFVLTGYMPLTLWRHLTNSMVLIYRRSVPLLYHRSISLFDIVFARSALEFIAISAAFLIVWSALVAVDLASSIAHLDLVLVGWLMMAWLGSGAGLVLASITERYEGSERLVQPVQYLMIPMSGAFAMVDWLPHWTHQWILLNPMVHCYEVVRAGYFGSSVTAHYSYFYFICWAFALWFIGIICVHRTRGHVQIS
jgi:capsular polysaccharide transport system permease protein